MKRPSPLLATLCAAASFCSLPFGAAFGAEPGKAISLSVTSENAFPFPKNILGAQDEVTELSYVTDKEWKAMASAGVSLLRYPAGTPADWFVWNDPAKGYWGEKGDWGYSRKKMFPDEFLADCRAYGIQPLLTVNTSSYGAPVDKCRINPGHIDDIRRGAEFAAKWVKDVNIDKKENVKLWEIGNEVWVWLYPREYVQYVIEYSKAMRAVDPSIKILACGLTANLLPFNASWLNFPDDPAWKPRTSVRNYSYEWNNALLKDAAGSFDYLVLHHYMEVTYLDPESDGMQLFSDVVECPPLEDAIRWIKENHSSAKIAMTEWMMNFGWDPVFSKGTYSNGNPELRKSNFNNSPAFSFVTALAAADFIGRMAATGYVDIGVAHTVQNGLFRRWDNPGQKKVDPPVAMPVGLALQFWGKYAGETMLPTEVDKGAPFYLYSRLRVPKVSAYATRTGNKVSLILINRTPAEALTLSAPTAIAGQPVVRAVEHRVYASSWGDNLWAGVTDAVATPVHESQRDVPLAELPDYTLKPCGLVCLELELAAK